MTDEYSGGITRFVAGLEADGYLPDPGWKEAFGTVPRHVFSPVFFTSLPDGRWQAIDAAHPDYSRLVYADTTLTTQLDGAVEPDPTAGPVAGIGTSSSTQPGLMALMLHALRVSGGQRVLEIGTGTGYNAALLAHRLGERNVTSVEVDPAVAEHARHHLADAGYRPTVATGDGEQGWADGAPYNRLIATVSVSAVPRAWIAQVRDGGSIVTSLWRDLGGGPLVRLEVNGGTAQGFFLRESGGFMPVRSAKRATAALAAAVKQTGDGRVATVSSGVLHDADAGLWIALQVRDVTWLGFTPDGGHDQVWLFAVDGSWAMVEDATAGVEQYGQRNLWDEVEAAYDRWAQAGQPRRERLGLTVTGTGVHRFWLDTPDALQWEEIPTPR